MTTTIGLFHATLNAVGPVVDAWTRCGTPVSLQHHMDEGLLPLAATRGPLDPAVIERLRTWLDHMANDGVDAIMTTCSSLTPTVAALRPAIRRPVVAIDEAMLEEALARGSRIGIVATVEGAASTTRRLLEQAAATAGCAIGTRSTLADGAFAALSRGDLAMHDRAVCAAAARLAPEVDVLVFAQVSMSRVLVPRDMVPVPVLTSAAGAVRRTLEAVARRATSAG